MLVERPRARTRPASNKQASRNNPINCRCGDPPAYLFLLIMPAEGVSVGVGSRNAGCRRGAAAAAAAGICGSAD